jgi:hypothetical protein
MDGSNKRKPLFIRTHAKPAVLKNINPLRLQVNYANSRKAWMDRHLWSEWLKNLTNK